MDARTRKWLESLSEYDFEITYIKGTMNKLVDALSHRPTCISFLLSLKTNLRERILELKKEYEWYQEVKGESKNEVMQVPK